jgi:UDP-N-acetylmuramyl-tripeptide synthetase
VARAVSGTIAGNREVSVTDITHDSRQVEPGWGFVAIPGFMQDGSKFVAGAIERGASVVISESPAPGDIHGAWITVANAREALAQAAAAVHHHPSRELKLLGVTGTNGKTTNVYLIAALAAAAGDKRAMFTTVEHRVDAVRYKADRTTPEACDTQRMLRHAVDAGCRVAAMECSSQALDLHRCDALEFAVAVFTNLTHDHLDYHHTMENYYDAKLRLFNGATGARPGLSVINIDDEYGARLAHDLDAAGMRVVTCAIDAKAEIWADEINVSLDGVRFNLHTPLGTQLIVSPLVGRPHVYNILTSAACGLELGYRLDQIAAGLVDCIGAPGRFERVRHDGDFTVVVDYAHTDDALINTLRSARGITPGRIITVFGCGGDRDNSKRALMGAAAARHSDLVFITSDNPRTEDPAKILNEAEAGLKELSTPYSKIADRRTAINEAIATARTGDLVVIAGKGHEDYQIIGRETFHFDDREVAREALGS